MLVISAGGIYVLENELQPEAFGSMPACLGWAIVTLAAVGYGEVVSVTALGKMFDSIMRQAMHSAPDECPHCGKALK